MPKKKTEPSKIILPDQKDRDAVVTLLDETIMVEAGAGSGKTTSMVKRMVALIAEGKAEIGKIAAVTFTRKAAAELRQKFQISLEKGFREYLGPKRERLGAALRDLEQIFVGTVHSFCAQLLRERPVEAGIDPDFTEMVEIDDYLHQNEVWEEYLSTLLYRNDETLSLLHELDVAFDELKETFHTLVLYPEVDVYEKEPPLPEIEDAKKEVKKFISFALPLIPKSVPDKEWDGLQDAILSVNRGMNAFNINEIKDFFRTVSPLEGSKQLTQNRWNSSEDAKIAQAKFEELQKSVIEPVLKQWREYRHSYLVRIIKPASDLCRQKRREASTLNFQDLLMLAASLLRDNPEARNYFKKRFTHLLIDEFQDTDPIQAEVILYLTGEDLDERNWQKLKPAKGTLFVVGDPKQSIYRFRRADIDIYNIVKEIILKSGGRLLELKSNFRSVRSMGAWLNPIFEKVFPVESSQYQAKFSMLEMVRDQDVRHISGIRKITVPRVSRHKSELIVEHDSLRIASWMRHALDGNVTIERTDDEKSSGLTERPVPSDFLILLRNKKMIPAYAKRLEEFGIPFEVAGGNALTSANGIAELLKILKAIAEPDSSLDLVSALRGLFFGVSDDMLYKFKKAGGRFYFLSSIPKNAHEDIRSVFEAVFARLKTYRDWSRSLPPSVAIEKIIEDVGLVQYLLNSGMGGSQTGNILKLLEYLQHVELAGNSEFYSIVEGLEHMIAEGEMDEIDIAHGSQKAVRIMNLHKAKGLEAPVVFLANPSGASEHPAKLHIKRKGDKASGYFVISHRPNFQDKIIALPPYWDEYETEENSYDAAEEDRLLYVAATRAKNLLVVSSYPENSNKNPWALFLPYLGDIRELETISPESKKPEMLLVKNKDFIEFQKSVAKSVADFSQETYTTITVTSLAKEDVKMPAWKKTGRGLKWGDVIHRALDAVSRGIEGKELEVLITNILIEEGRPPDEKPLVLSLIEGIKKSEFWAEVQNADKKYMEVPFSIKLMPSEIAITSLSGKYLILSGTIDLVYKGKDGWTIVDYKTDDIGDDFKGFINYYSPQVKAYARFWQEMSGEKVEKAGLFFVKMKQFVPVSL